MTYKILAVDDEEINLRLIEGFLDESLGYEVVKAHDGQEGWDILARDYENIDVVLLDRMMPQMDGMEFIHKANSHDDIKKIPIIMQTAAAEKSQVAEGINAGVYYYLTKPYDEEVLLSIVDAAIANYADQHNLREEVSKHQQMIEYMVNSQFMFNTLYDARSMATYIASFFPDPGRVVMGLSEIFINAVEHGNLGITYDEKTALNEKGVWESEVIKRQEYPEYRYKKVKVFYEKTDHEAVVKVVDEGQGFDWREYMDISPERATDNHGRGIAMSNMMSFDQISYVGNGNEVYCRVSL